MSSPSIDQAPEASVAAFGDRSDFGNRAWIACGTAAVTWLVVSLVTALWPDKPDSDWEYTQNLAILFAATGVALACGVIASLRSAVPQRIQNLAPWLLVLAILVAAWEVVTAKLGLLPMPFFPPPQAILEVMVDDWPRLLESVVASLRLLAGGYLIGATVGFVIGVAIGWSRPIGYWIHPILRVVGPLPATAWLPLAFFVFP